MKIALFVLAARQHLTTTEFPYLPRLSSHIPRHQDKTAKMEHSMTEGICGCLQTSRYSPISRLN